MMPGAQLKMLRYIRNPEPKGNGPGGSPKASQPVSAPQHAPPPLASRQPLVDAVKMAVPVSGRYANSSQPPATAPIPTFNQPSSRHPPRQHTRAHSDNGRVRAPSEQEQQMWEDSTVNSMFADSITGTTKHRSNHGRYDSPFPPPQRPQQYDRITREKDLSPFIIGGDGLMKVISTPNGTTAATVNTSTFSNGFPDTSALEDPYVQKSHYDSPPKNNHTLRHAKFPFRDARAAKRGSLVDRLSRDIKPEEIEAGSPERLRHVQSALETGDRGLADNRSTYFHDVDTPLRRTPAPQDDEISEAPSQGDEATNQQRTPRQTRPSASAPSFPKAKALQESSLPRTSSHREKKTTSRKRRLSLDYDDHALHSMSYSDLKEEAFDYDPARVAIQAATVPTGESLEDKLLYYRNKDENDQHHFFTQITVQEWDASGDWFLEQFSGLVQKMKNQRQAKRKMVAGFEAEIADREKTVRSKAETIDLTLNELKRDGEGMMKGRDADL